MKGKYVKRRIWLFLRKERMIIMRNISRFCLTNSIILMYCLIWQILEFIIDGQVTNRKVDNIIMLLFTPIIWIATDRLIKKETKKEIE